MSRVLGIDPGGTAGFAHGKVGGSPINGIIRLPPKISPARRYLIMEGRVRNLIADNEIDYVWIEAPFVQPDPAKFDIKMVRLAYGYQAAILMACEKEGIPQENVQLVEPATWRSYFLNTTRAPKHVPGDKTRDWLKDKAISVCQERGWSPKNRDSAEALGIWEFGCAQIDPKAVEGNLPLFAQLQL